MDQGFSSFAATFLGSQIVVVGEVVKVKSGVYPDTDTTLIDCLSVPSLPLTNRRFSSEIGD